MLGTVTQSKGNQKGANPLDRKMTPAQIARRKFKSLLPRKLQNRALSPMQALGELFTQLDQFRGIVRAEKQKMDADQTVYAALAYCLPESDPGTLAHTLTVPEPSKIGSFCNKVMSLERPRFLGIVFIQVDPDAGDLQFKATCFATQFLPGPEVVARLKYAQEIELTKARNVLLNTLGLGN